MKQYHFVVTTLIAGAVAVAGAFHSQSELLQADQGERRTWLPLPVDGSNIVRNRRETFTIKVDAQNGGSENLIMLAEDFPAGAEIRPHRHLHEDEIIYAENGTIRATVGGSEATLGPHATVFVPHDTWVSLKNVGAETVRLIAIFDHPNFDRYLRCSSATVGEPIHRVTKQQDAACAKLGDVEYRGD